MIEMDGTGKTPDIVIYNVFAGGLARNGLVQEAFAETNGRSGCRTHFCYTQHGH
jgi:hypothetical protein